MAWGMNSTRLEALVTVAKNDMENPDSDDDIGVLKNEYKTAKKAYKAHIKTEFVAIEYVESPLKPTKSRDLAPINKIQRQIQFPDIDDDVDRVEDTYDANFEDTCDVTVEETFKIDDLVVESVSTTV